METWNLIYTIVFYLFVAAFGLLVGSFLNVVIFRVPKEESVVKVRSHCMSCGYQLAWFDLIPVFSWLFLGGKCRKCKAKISAQYPIIEGLNAIFCILIFLAAYGFDFINVFENFDPVTILYCMMASALIALSVIDLRTYIIPFGINVFIFCLGIINLAYRIVKIVMIDGGSFKEVGIFNYLIGFIAVSGFLGIIYFASKGR
nr:prepilin peptidase [Lachnospiraceae bacterium]